MATYYLNNGAGGAATGADWTNAFLTYAAALAAATADGDIIKVHKAHTEELGADTTYTHQNNIAVICVDKDSSDALATMGTAAWIGNSTVNRSVTMEGAFFVYLYGITLRTAGSTLDQILLANTDGAHFEYESCYFWHGNTGANGGIAIGNADRQVFVKAKNCTFRLNAVSHRITVTSKLVIEGGELAATGTIPTGGFFLAATIDPAGAAVDCLGFDLSYLGSNPIVGNATSNAFTVRLSQCKLGASYVMLATQTNLNRSSAEVYIFDCFGGTADDASEHGRFGYANAMGSIVSDDVIKLSAGAAGQSWKITTEANCSFYTPFESPWISLYNTGTSAIEPYLEFLRNNDGTSSTYDNDEVWIDVMAKTTADSTASTLYTDRMTLLGSPAAQASSALGAGDWAGETGTCAYGVIKAPSLTPAEPGHIMARVCVGTEIVGKLHVDPQIRT